MSGLSDVAIEHNLNRSRRRLHASPKSIYMKYPLLTRIEGTPNQVMEEIEVEIAETDEPIDVCGYDQFIANN